MVIWKVPPLFLNDERLATKLQNAIDIEAFGKNAGFIHSFSQRLLTEQRLNGLISDCVQSVVCADLNDDN